MAKKCPIKLREIRSALSDVDFRESTAMSGAVEINDVNYCRNKVIDLLKQYPYTQGSPELLDSVFKQCIQLMVLARILNGTNQAKTT